MIAWKFCHPLLTIRLVFGVCLVFAAAAYAPPIEAQALNNEPWGSGRPASAISPAGRQLILDEALYGIHPRHVLVGPDGSLLFVTKGPGGVAVATDQAGNSFAGALRNWSPYFATSYYGTGWVLDQDEAGAMLTTMAISDWTSAAGPGFEPIFANLLLPQGMNTVNAWTWQVYWLSDADVTAYETEPAPRKRSR
ncbi:MAG: hypothetical protein ACTHLR_00200 [Rhizomicrobium sp.]